MRCRCRNGTARRTAHGTLARMCSARASAGGPQVGGGGRGSPAVDLLRGEVCAQRDEARDRVGLAEARRVDQRRLSIPCNATGQWGRTRLWGPAGQGNGNGNERGGVARARARAPGRGNPVRNQELRVIFRRNREALAGRADNTCTRQARLNWAGSARECPAPILCVDVAASGVESLQYEAHPPRYAVHPTSCRVRAACKTANE